MKKTYTVEVDCPNCANLCEAEIAKMEGIDFVAINFMTQKMIIEFTEGIDEKKVMKSVYKACKRVEPDFYIEL